MGTQGDELWDARDGLAAPVCFDQMCKNKYFENYIVKHLMIFSFCVAILIIWDKTVRYLDCQSG